MFRWLAGVQAPFLSVPLPQPSLAVADRPHSLAFPSYSNVIRKALPACDQGYKMANSSGAKCWVGAHGRGYLVLHRGQPIDGVANACAADR